MDGGAKGVKMLLGGRLGGSEMCRSEGAALGSIPLSTLRAKIDYGFAEAKTAQGHIGMKVWVNQGDYLKGEPGEERLVGLHRPGSRSVLGAEAVAGAVPAETTDSRNGGFRFASPTARDKSTRRIVRA